MKRKSFKKLTAFVTAVEVAAGSKECLPLFGMITGAAKNIFKEVYMKKNKFFYRTALLLIMSALMLLTFSAFPVSADDLYADTVSDNVANPASDFIYSEFKRSITIEKYIGTSKNVVIPSIIDNCEVYAIGENAFADNQNIESVVIGEYTQYIWKDAFKNCTKLASVVIPSSVTYLGSSAFANCSNLTSVNIPSSITYLSGIFYGCSSLTSITIPDSVTSIGAYTFKNCTSLKNITIPNSVTTLGYAAFMNSGLTDITIPQSVTVIESDVFAECSMLTDIKVNEKNQSFTSIDGVLFTKAIDKLMQYPNGKSGNSYIIPDTVTSIARSAFSECSELTSVYIPNSVTSIGYNAFNNCTGLTEVTIPKNVTSMEGSAFNHCTGLTSVIISYGVTTIGEFTFNGCTGLTAVIIPSSVTSIEGCAFSNCTGLTEVIIPSSVTYLGSHAFSNCSSLTSVDILGSITSIGEYTFYSCHNLTTVTIPDSVTSIGDSAFYYCDKLASVEIPDSVTIIGDEAFYCCERLTDIKIPKSVSSIGIRCFYCCINLTSVKIADGVGSIREGAFEACNKLTSITIPGSVTYIGNKAFSCCRTMTKVEFNSGIKTIGDNAFSYCYNLTYITIPDSVEFIGDDAFTCCNKLVSVTIPESVTSIGNNAFSGSYRTIYGKTGSYAEIYATENSIPFAENSIVTFISQPENTIVNAGEDANFSVDIKNSNASYIWCEMKPPAQGETSGWEYLYNENQPTLTINNVNKNLNGYLYRCIIIVDGEQVTSRYAILTVMYTMEPDHTHSYGTEWKYDNTSHWHECICGEKSEPETHIKDNGYAYIDSIESGYIIYFCSVCGIYMDKEKIDLTITDFEVVSDKVIVYFTISESGEILSSEFAFNEIPNEIVELMKSKNIQLVIDFVNYSTVGSDNIILTSAQIKAIEYVLEYDIG